VLVSALLEVSQQKTAWLLSMIRYYDSVYSKLTTRELNPCKTRATTEIPNLELREIISLTDRAGLGQGVHARFMQPWLPS